MGQRLNACGSHMTGAVICFNESGSLDETLHLSFRSCTVKNLTVTVVKTQLQILDLWPSSKMCVSVSLDDFVIRNCRKITENKKSNLATWAQVVWSFMITTYDICPQLASHVSQKYNFYVCFRFTSVFPT